MSILASAARNYIRYSDGLEEIAPDEQETIDKIGQLMSKGAETVKEKYHSPSASPTPRRMGRCTVS